MLSTIYNIEVNYPVSNSLHNKIIKNLATKGVKIEIYTEKSTPLKTYYIGQPAANMIGSYMLLENSSKPFVMYIPGFNGFLAPRYNIDGSKVDEELWKDRIILDFNPKTIASVEIINHDQEELSYSISKDSSNNFILNYNNQQTELSDNFGIKYFELFNKISCEGFMNGFSKKDSIINSKPFHSIEIKSEQKNMSFKTFHKSPKRKEYLDGNGLSLKYDPDRFYALIDSDFTLIQFYVFNKLILDPNKIPVEK